jgi:uncharacterized protein
MEGLRFQTAAAPVRSDPARADIACFVGFVAPRYQADVQRRRLERALEGLGWVRGRALPGGDRVIPAQILPYGDSPRSFVRWLAGLGWRRTVNAVADIDLFRRAAAAVLTEGLAEWWQENAWLSAFSERRAADLLELFDVPVPIDTWDAFDALFAWERRPLVGDRFADTTLGAVVRRFFLQGGRKCYVVRVGDPWPLFTNVATRTGLRAHVLRTVPLPAPVDRSTWRGVGHLFGLPDVSFLCAPDLPELFAVDPGPTPPEPVVIAEERFVECATRIDPPASRTLRTFPVPRCDGAAFAGWAVFVGRIASLLQRHCREAQFIASIPLPDEPPSGLLAGGFTTRAAQWSAIGSIQTAFVQLTYPWLMTRESPRLPGAVEPPEGMLAGILANNALTAGTWRTVARQPVFGLSGLEPLLSGSELERPLPFQGAIGGLRVPRSRRERVSVFAPTPTGFQLLSDVTTDDDEAYRPANVNRLVASLVRAARLVGEKAVFANNGEVMWRRLRSALESLLLQLWGDGALDGETSSAAFEVRCDRSTMTQADLDAGRIIARVQFAAAGPIDLITVVFAMDEGGQVTLTVPQPRDPMEATA